MSIRTVAFIGVGSMGAPMARRARKAGFDLIVCDKDRAVRDAFAAQGARVTTEARDCASADAIVVLVANDVQLLGVTIGPEGLAGAIPAGHRPVICIMSTTLPKTLEQLVTGLAGTGARVLDAPISGGIVRAEQGTLTIIQGGDPADVAAVRPLMEAMGERLFHCGSLGAAEVVKLINNSLCIATMYLAAEAIELAESHGVRFEQIAPVLDVSTGRNFLTADPVEARQQYAAWARSEDAFAALVKVVSKDLHMAQELAEATGLSLRLLKKVSEHVDATDDAVMHRWMRHGRVP